MYPNKFKIARVLIALIFVVSGFALTGSHALAASVTFNLCASTGTATLPGSVSVPFWGFALVTTPGDCVTGIGKLPGPVLEANEGDVVTVNVYNALPAGHSATFELSGFALTLPAVNQYQFTAGRSGTFVYQSSGDAGRQMAMGLYGALVVRPAGEAAGFATGNCSTAAGAVYGNPFDRECVLVLSAVDPNFNAAPDTFDMNDYLATYWLVNGAAYPDTSAIAAPAGQRLLLRYVNAGFDYTSMMLLGAHEQVLGRDGYALNNPFLASTEVIPSGATEDAIVTVPSTAAPTTNGFPLFNRNLHVTNGAPASDPGGMLIFIQP